MKTLYKVFNTTFLFVFTTMALSPSISLAAEQASKAPKSGLTVTLVTSQDVYECDQVILQVGQRVHFTIDKNDNNEVTVTAPGKTITSVPLKDAPELTDGRVLSAYEATKVGTEEVTVEIRQAGKKTLPTLPKKIKIVVLPAPEEHRLDLHGSHPKKLEVKVTDTIVVYTKFKDDTGLIDLSLEPKAAETDGKTGVVLQKTGDLNDLEEKAVQVRSYMAVRTGTAKLTFVRKHDGKISSTIEVTVIAVK